MLEFLATIFHWLSETPATKAGREKQQYYENREKERKPFRRV